MSIKCASGHENPDGSAFCDECGLPLAAPTPTPAVAKPAGVACPACQLANEAGLLTAPRAADRWPVPRLPWRS